MSKKLNPNPIEEIYKCSILNGNGAVPGGVPKCILVFYGSNELIPKKETSLTQLYNAYIENGSNSKLFENIFSKMELKNIATYNIKVHIIDFKIYSDDTIDVVKRKIMMAAKTLLERGYGSESEFAEYAYDEMYLFSKTPITFDSNDVYHQMTELAEQGKDDEKKIKESEFLKKYLMGYSNDSGEPIDPNSVKDVFATLKKLNADALFKDVSIGQSIPANAYVNPFFFKRSEIENSKIKSKMNHLELLLNTRNIVHNTLFACFARDVLQVETEHVADVEREEALIRTYYPLLYTEGIKSLSELKSESSNIKLDERTEELLNSAEFKMNINQIRLFYDIFDQSSKPKIKSEEAGIIGVDLELLPESDFNFPLELLFKLFHATEQCQLVKYNPPFQDAILRMYTKNQTKGGKKIPYLLIQYQSDSNKIYDFRYFINVYIKQIKYELL